MDLYRLYMVTKLMTLLHQILFRFAIAPLLLEILMSMSAIFGKGVSQVLRDVYLLDRYSIHLKQSKINES